MKDDREYLSPLQATTERCSLPIRILTHPLSCWNRVDVQSLTIALCSRHHRSLCESMANECEEMFSKTPDKRSQDVDNIPRTMKAFSLSVLSTQDIQVPRVVEVIDQPK